MLNLKSHDIETLREAHRRGELIFALWTDTDGHDDVLTGTCVEDVRNDVLNYHDLETLPAYWSIEQLDDGQLVAEGVLFWCEGCCKVVYREGDYCERCQRIG